MTLSVILHFVAYLGLFAVAYTAGYLLASIYHDRGLAGFRHRWNDWRAHRRWRRYWNCMQKADKLRRTL